VTFSVSSPSGDLAQSGFKSKLPQRRPRKEASGGLTKPLSDRTTSFGNNAVPKLTPLVSEGGVMDIVVALLLLASIGVFAAHALDALRAG
jgi:hypothetical protein